MTNIARIGLVVVAGAAVAAAGYARAVRPWQLRWGATDDEVGGPLPGDDVLPDADHVATRAISVQASADDVWPWVAQLGQGRGGFYSYDRLENVAGCQIHSADRVVPEWQDVAAGDEFRLHPDTALRVIEVDAPNALVIGGGVRPTGQTDDTGLPVPYDFTWAFVVVAAHPEVSRVLVRERYAYRSPRAALLVEPVSVVSFVMTQRMLRGIRDRAERTTGAQ